jgi:Protein of unknown function (DUF1566)
MHAKPIWDINGASWVDHPANPRFAILSAGATSPAGDAVLDEETGLVWERSPATNKMVLEVAILYAATKVAVQRKGWRLPALEELLSLVDPANNPTLPTGHPFVNVQLDYFYWSLTRAIPEPNDQNLIWGYNFGNADTSSIVVATDACYAWLVRGGYGHNYTLTI